MRFTCIHPSLNLPLEFEGDASVKFALFGKRGKRGMFNFLCGTSSKNFARLPDVARTRMAEENMDSMEYAEAVPCPPPT